MKFDKYTRIARIYPAIISIIPLMLLINVLMIDFKSEFLDNLLLKISFQLSLGVILIYLISQINRFISKEFFEKNYFKDETQFPTTNLLLLNDTNFSESYKNKIRSKIKTDFNIELPEKQFENENIEKTRLEIKDIVGIIRTKLKNNSLLLQHNIEYGFIRNLIGGSPIGIIFSLMLLLYSFFIHPLLLMQILSIILTLFFMSILFFHKYLMRQYGILYAKKLFQEYLAE